jgi:starvation-inducible DNA-binding protein
MASPNPSATVDQEETDVTAGLNRMLASATVFYQKARHYHWNVTGPHFFTLHDEFEELYEFWSDAIDALAERIRSRGDRPVHTLADVLDLTSIDEDPSVPTASEMVRSVTEDLSALDEQAQRLSEQAEAAGDEGTATVLDDLSEQIEEDRWMLRAWLDEQ